jgi:hypothetical protein
VLVKAPPDLPGGVAAVGGNGVATVTFNAPLDDNGAIVTHYTVTTTKYVLRICIITPFSCLPVVYTKSHFFLILLIQIQLD